MSEPDFVIELRRRIAWAEVAGLTATSDPPRHSVIVMTGDELQRLESYVWKTTGCPPAHIERFDGRRVVIEEP